MYRSTMFRCEGCGAEFETPARVKVLMGEYWGAPAYDELMVCPDCKYDELTELTKCRLCDEWADNVYCQTCLGTAKTMLMQLFDRLELELAISYKEAVDLADEAFQSLEG